MSQHLKFIRSNVPGKIPTTSSLDFGEFAINTYDGLAFIKKSGSSGEEIVAVGSTAINAISASYALTASYSMNGGGGGGGVTGGTTSYIPLWTSPTSLSSSIFYQSGSSIFLNSTKSLYSNTSNPEKFGVYGGVTNSFTLINGQGSINEYLQFNIQNNSTGNDASTDIVATSDDGNEATGYIDMGINSSGYSADTDMGTAGDAYLYSTGNDLYIGNNSAGKKLILFNGSGSANLAARMLIDPGGTVSINSSAFTPGNPEALYVQALSNTTINIITAKADINNYSQVNIHNTNSGNNASSDITATADNGSEVVNYINFGINSSNFTGVVGGINDGYLYSTGNDLHIGNATTGKTVSIFAGGLDTDTNAKLVLSYNNLHELTGSLNVSGGLIVSNGVIITGSLVNGNVGNVALGTGSHAEGQGTIASGSYQHAEGQFNLQNNTSSLLIIGNGTNTASRSDLALFNINSIIFNKPVTGSIFSGSFIGVANTASYANTSSYANTASYADTASFAPLYVLTSATSSMSVLSASYARTSSIAVSSSYAATASFAPLYVLTSQTSSMSVLSSSYASTASLAPLYVPISATSSMSVLSSSYASTASLAPLYVLISSTSSMSVLSASYASTASLAPLYVLTSATSSMTVLSASYAATASLAPLYVPNSGTSSMLAPYVLTSQTSSMTVLSASYAITSSLPLRGVVTASATNTTITFTRGDNTTFNVTVSQSGSVATSSYSLFAETAASASYAATASLAPLYVLTSVTSSMTVASSSRAISASYSDNANLLDGIDSTAFAGTGSNVFKSNQTITGSLLISGSELITGSLLISGSETITGSLNVSGGITGSLFGTSSWSNNSISSSYSLSSSYSSTSTTASYATTAQTLLGSVVSSSYAATASLAPLYVLISATSSMSVLSSSYALTSSYAATAQTLLGSVVSASYALSSSYSATATTASYATTAQTVLGVVTSASYAATASLAPLYVLTSVTSSMSVLSSSYASTASLAPLYVLSSGTSSMLAPYVLTSQTSSMTVLSSSYAVSASYLIGGATGTTYQIATGSVTASVNTTVDTFRVVSASNTLLNVKSNGNVQIGNSTDAGYKLDVSGSGRINGILDIASTSSLVTNFGTVVLGASGNDIEFANNAAWNGVKFYAGGALKISTTPTVTTINGTTINLGTLNLQLGGVGIIKAPSTDLQIGSVDPFFTTVTDYVNGTIVGRKYSTGNYYIGSTPSDSGYKLDVSGSLRITRDLTAGSSDTHTIGFLKITNGTIDCLAPITIGGATAGSVSMGVTNFTTPTAFVHNIGLTPANVTSTGYTYTGSFTNSGAGGTSIGNVINNNINLATSVGNVTLNNFNVLGTYSASAGTTLSRGFYFNPTIQGSVGLSLHAFENVIGDNFFNTNSGSTYIGTLITSSFKLDVAGDIRTTGSLTISSSLYSNTSSIATAATSSVIFQIVTSSYTAGFFDYTVSSGSNARAGTVMSVWNNSSSSYTDNSTADIGNTNDISFSIDLSGSLVRLKSTTTTSQWNVKTTARLI
jgi:hypothetical protein